MSVNVSTLNAGEHVKGGQEEAVVNSIEFPLEYTTVQFNFQNIGDTLITTITPVICPRAVQYSTCCIRPVYNYYCLMNCFNLYLQVSDLS
jgi:hypothetical protein